jgi:N,N-dimethylformamidase beta subunit-like protein
MRRSRGARGWWTRMPIRTRVLAVVGVALALLAADGAVLLLTSRQSVDSQTHTNTAAIVIPRAPIIPINPLILDENQLPGTDSWLIPPGHGALDEIQGYTDMPSAAPSQTVSFFVSTQQAGTPYQADVYRLGWYGGAGARLLTTLHETGQAQGYYEWNSKALISCWTCTMDASTKLIEAHWQPSFTVTVAANWVTGLYIAKLTDANDKQTYVPFEVRGNDHSMYLVSIPDATTAAYNDWADTACIMGQIRRWRHGRTRYR